MKKKSKYSNDNNKNYISYLRRNKSMLIVFKNARVTTI